MPIDYSKFRSVPYGSPELYEEDADTSAVARGFGMGIAGLGSTMRDLGLDDAGQATEDYGTDLIMRNPSPYQDVGDILDAPLGYIPSVLGEQVAQLSVGIPAAIGLGTAGTALGGPVGGFVGAGAGLAAPTFVQEYGLNRISQREKGIDDPGRAALAAGGVAAIDVLSGPARLGTRLLTGGLRDIARETEEGIFKAAGKQGLEEGAAELAQAPIGRWGSYEPLTGADAMNEYLMSAIGGIAVGGTIGGGMRALAGRRQPVDLLQDMETDGQIARDADGNQILLPPKGYQPAGTDPIYVPPQRPLGLPAPRPEEIYTPDTRAPVTDGIARDGEGNQLMLPNRGTLPAGTDPIPAPPPIPTRPAFATGEVLPMLREANGGKSDSWLLKFTNTLTGSIAQGRVDLAEQAIADARTRLEGAAIKPETIDRRALVLDLAQTAVADYVAQARQLADARYAQGVQDRPGVTVTPPVQPGTDPAGSSVNMTEVQMRERNASQHLDEALPDANRQGLALVQERGEAAIEQRRLQILDRVLADPETINPAPRFKAELRRAGIYNTALAPAELQTIGRYMEMRDQPPPAQMEMRETLREQPVPVPDVAPPVEAASPPPAAVQGELFTQDGQPAVTPRPAPVTAPTTATPAPAPVAEQQDNWFNPISYLVAARTAAQQTTQQPGVQRTFVEAAEEAAGLRPFRPQEEVDRLGKQKRSAYKAGYDFGRRYQAENNPDAVAAREADAKTMAELSELETEANDGLENNEVSADEFSQFMSLLEAARQKDPQALGASDLRRSLQDIREASPAGRLRILSADIDNAVAEGLVTPKSKERLLRLAAPKGVPTPDAIDTADTMFDEMVGAAVEARSREDAAEADPGADDAAALGVDDVDQIHDALTEDEQDRLAEHYGRDEYDDVARQQFIDDVVTAVNRGINAVSRAIRDIVRKIAEGVLAVALVFNVSTLDLPAAGTSQAFAATRTVSITEQVPAEAVANMSDRAVAVYEAMAPVAKRQAKGFFIADKPSGQIHIFDASGAHVDTSPALYGTDVGDTMPTGRDAKGLRELGAGDKITPAGRFQVRMVEAPTYDGGYVLQLRDADGQRVGGEAYVAIHSVWNGRPAEGRPGRLASDDALDNKVSMGCINTTMETFVDKVMPRAAEFDGGMVMVLPDDVTRTAELFQPETRTETVQMAQEQPTNDGTQGGERQQGMLPRDRLARRRRQPLMAGSRATQADGAKQSTARLLEAGDADPETIRQQTGWFRGADGNWRFEIDDSKATFDFDKLKNASPQVKFLDQLLKHPDLFRNYPDVRDIAVEIDPSLSAADGNRAYFMPPHQGDFARIGLAADMADPVPSLFHELQHWIQAHEMFEQGTSSEDVSVQEGDLVKMRRELARRLEPIAAQDTPLDRIKRFFGLPSAFDSADPDFTPDGIRRAIKVLKDPHSTKYSADDLELARWMAYRMTAGETEARNVAKRVRFSEQDRASTPPAATQDVATENQLLQGSGPTVTIAEAPRPRQASQDAPPASTPRMRQAKTRATATINRLPPKVRGPVQRIWDNLFDASKKGVIYTAFTQDLVDMADRYLPAARAFLDLWNQRTALKRRHEQTVEQVMIDYDKLQAADRALVNKFLYDSTTSGKWGFAPGWVQGIVPDAELGKQFRALPDAARGVVKRVLEHGHETLQAKKQGVRDAIIADYDGRIAEAKADGDQGQLTRLTNEKADELRRYETLMRIAANSPYAPLKRFGNYVTVARSQAYMDAEEAQDLALLKDLETQPEHYYVSFHETMGEAQETARRLRDMGLYVPPSEGDVEGGVQAFQRDATAPRIGSGAMFQAFERLRRMIDDTPDMSARQQSALRNMVSDLYLTTLSETSARKSEMHRRLIAGADADMMRAFASQGKADAHFIAALHKNKEMLDALSSMKRESKQGGTATRGDRARFLNEFMKRHAMALELQDPGIAGRINQMTSLWLLATNPAYYFQNATQTAVMTQPYIAARYGYGKAAGALMSAYRAIAPLVKDTRVDRPLDLEKVPEDVRDAIRALTERGRIDIGLERDLGERASSDTSTPWNRVNMMLTGTVQKVETINRLSAAIAAYKLARASGKTEAQAVDYADEVIRVTHGDYSSFAAPRAFNHPVGKVLLQFKKFQLIQISMMTRLINNSLRGATPEERSVARKAIMFNLAHAGVLGGMIGLPGMAAMTWLFEALFEDEDDPLDTEQALRDYLGDGALADLLTRGVPAAGGVDLSGRLGMGQMLSLFPFTDLEASQEGYQKALTAAAGPFFGGLMPRMADGVGLIGDGEYYKGLEKMLPAILANSMRGFRAASEGVTDKSGDMLLPPDEVGAVAGVMQALGLPTTALTDQRRRSNVAFETNEFFKDRTADLKQQYIEAETPAEKAEVRKAWTAYQQSRVENGFKRQPMSELLKAPREKAKRERNTAGGVQFTNSNRQFVEDL